MKARLEKASDWNYREDYEFLTQDAAFLWVALMLETHGKLVLDRDEDGTLVVEIYDYWRE